MTAENKENITDKSAAPETAPAAPTTETADNGISDNVISIEDFFKVQLKVGQILTAEPVEKSKKLLKLTVDLGETDRGPRQIVSGIAKQYTPESLPGRKIVVVANLKPAQLMGNLSEGMLLAACAENGDLELVSPGAALPVGSTVR